MCCWVQRKNDLFEIWSKIRRVMRPEHLIKVLLSLFLAPSESVL